MALLAKDRVAVVTFTIADDRAMREFGAKLAATSISSGVIYLVGELGAGKTTLVRGFLQSLGHQGAVKSPTYTLVEHYHVAHRHIYHLDLYRLADPEELEFIGLRDWLQAAALLLIEWPQMAEGVVPKADLIIRIDYEGAARILRLDALSVVGEALLSTLDDA